MNGSQPLTIQRARNVISNTHQSVINLSSSHNSIGHSQRTVIGGSPVVIQRSAATANSVIQLGNSISNGLQNGNTVTSGNVIINNTTQQQAQQILSVNNGQLNSSNITVGGQQQLGTQQLHMAGQQQQSTQQLQVVRLSNGQTVALNGNSGQQLFKMSNGQTYALSNGKLYVVSQPSTQGVVVSQPTAVTATTAPQTLINGNQGYSTVTGSQQQPMSVTQVSRNGITKVSQVGMLNEEANMVINRLTAPAATTVSNQLQTTLSSQQQTPQRNQMQTSINQSTSHLPVQPSPIYSNHLSQSLSLQQQLNQTQPPQKQEPLPYTTSSSVAASSQAAAAASSQSIINTATAATTSVQNGSGEFMFVDVKPKLEPSTSQSTSSISNQYTGNSNGPIQSSNGQELATVAGTSVATKADITQEQAQPKQDEEPEMDIFINNVVCSFSVRCHLNLKEIALSGSNVEYRRENGMVTMKLRHPYTTASIWSSGKVTCTGANTEDDAKIAARKFSRILQKLDPKYESIRIKNWRIVNVLGTCNLPFGIKIVPFSQAFKEASYEPELHPGVTYKLKHPKATLKIFSTGSITVTAPSVANVQAAIEHIYPKVCEYQKPKDIEELKADQLRGTKRKHYITNAVGDKSKAKKKAKMLAKLGHVSENEEGSGAETAAAK